MPERARWGTISRDQVVEEAVRVVLTDGYEQLTMRRLADALGVAPMAIYRHVRDKDDLLDEVVDRLLASAWRPHTAERHVRAWVVQAAERLRRFLVEQPAALRVYLGHPVSTPTALARMDAMVRVLTRLCGDEEAALRAYAAIQTYTLGFAALQAGRADRPQRAYADGTIERQLARFATARQFGEGLGYLLDGIEATAQQ